MVNLLLISFVIVLFVFFISSLSLKKLICSPLSNTSQGLCVLLPDSKTNEELRR